MARPYSFVRWNTGDIPPKEAWNDLQAAIETLDAGGTNYTAYGSATLTITTASAAYTALTSDTLILATAGSAGWTLTLYAATGNTGRVLRVKKVDSGAGTISVAGAGGDLIDGQATYGLVAQWTAVTLCSTGSAWVVIAEVA